jgi:hypothetical protein
VCSVGGILGASTKGHEQKKLHSYCVQIIFVRTLNPRTVNPVGIAEGCLFLPVLLLSLGRHLDAHVFISVYVR